MTTPAPRRLLTNLTEQELRIFLAESVGEMEERVKTLESALGESLGKAERILGALTEAAEARAAAGGSAELVALRREFDELRLRMDNHLRHEHGVAGLRR